MSVNENDLNVANEEYLKEMETNNLIFQEKMQKLNNLILNTNQEIEKSNAKAKNINNVTPLSKIIISEHSDKKNQEKESFGMDGHNYSDRNRININTRIDKDLNNLSSNKNNSASKINFNKKKLYNDIISDNENVELYRQIEKLKNENSYKNYLIQDLEKQLNEKPKKNFKNLNNNNTNCENCNKLLADIDDKDYRIQKLENEIKHLKLKIDNLMIENNKIKTENNNLNNKREELKAILDSNKIDLLNLNNKVKELEKANRQLNKDYLSLSKDFKKIRNDKEDLKSLVDEQNAAIYNYQKQNNILKTNIDKKNRNNKGNYIYKNNYILDNYHKNINNSFDDDLNTNRNILNNKKIRNKDLNCLNSYEYKMKINNDLENLYNDDSNENNEDLNFLKRDSGEKYNYINRKYNINYNYRYPQNDNEYNDDKQKNNNYIERKINYSYEKDSRRKEINDNKINRVNSQRNIQMQKGELNYLENYLSTLLKERGKLENDVNQLPEHPRTLTDVRLRNSLNDKIKQNEKETENVKRQLRRIRGY